MNLYTGLKDKHGQLIVKGDQVRIDFTTLADTSFYRSNFGNLVKAHNFTHAVLTFDPSPYLDFTCRMDFYPQVLSSQVPQNEGVRLAEEFFAAKLTDLRFFRYVETLNCMEKCAPSEGRECSPKEPTPVEFNGQRIYTNSKIKITLTPEFMDEAFQPKFKERAAKKVAVMVMQITNKNNMLDVTSYYEKPDGTLIFNNEYFDEYGDDPWYQEYREDVSWHPMESLTHYLTLAAKTKTPVTISEL